MRPIPPIQWLTSFEAVMRHRHMTRAAEELSLTQGAVSQHILKLEAALGVPLFSRKGGRLEPTEHATAYIEPVAEGLEKLKEATNQIHESYATSGSLTVTVPTSFGVQWLIPRIAAFNKQYPGIQLHILNRDSIDPNDPDLMDLALEMHLRDEEDNAERAVFFEYLVPVCAPSLAEKFPRPSAAQDLLDWPIVHLDRQFDQSSEIWLRNIAGVRDTSKIPGPRFSRQVYAVKAAINGAGVAFVPESSAEQELKNGQLIVPLNKGTWSADALVPRIPRFRVQNIRIQTFLDWLRDQTASNRERFWADIARA